MADVEHKLIESGSSDRHAWFVSALAVAWPNGDVAAFEGQVHGDLVFPPRGTHGFGYDPIFVPDGERRTSAELSSEEKDAISHRGNAMRALVPVLRDLLPAQS